MNTKRFSSILNRYIITAIVVFSIAITSYGQEAKYKSDNPKPYPLLNPPDSITPAMTREWFSWSFPEWQNPDPNAKGRLPRQTWTKNEHAVYEKRVEWFHNAKFGLFFHFLSGGKWTSEEWNKWVDAVDVEKIANQAKELGAGYVEITLGQNQIFSCAPNPIIEKYWGKGYTSNRDLPMDLYEALKKREIPMMLYIATDAQYKMPRPETMKGDDRFNYWIEVAQWYSDHYGAKCKGWWVDGLEESIKDYRVNIHNALKHGNSDALVCSGSYEISDMIHGHCQPNWTRQSQVVKPFYGRWDPDFSIQWHTFQYIGRTWGAPGCDKKQEDIVKYAIDAVKGGGVITFDIGTFKEGCFYDLPKDCQTGVKPDGTRLGPYLEIQPDQYKILKEVSKALKNIKPSAGKK